MLNSAGSVIYVGKAKNLSKRVHSYFTGSKDLKTSQLVKHVADINVTITNTEAEAFLLEIELIKQLQPKYNILFKDAKSYPYLKITSSDEFPQLTFYRGNRQAKADYYGPYPGIRAAKEGLELLQRIFKLRSCDNNFFKNRQRACLQYQIQRCSAPCVGLITREDYALDIANAKQFLQGKTTVIIAQLSAEMEKAAELLEYERAAQLREQIVTLRKIQQQQIIVATNTNYNADVVGVDSMDDLACLHLLCIRNGRMLGSKQYFTNQNTTFLTENPTAEILEAFILQHYSNASNYQQNLDELILAIDLPNKAIVAEVISKSYGKKFVINYYSKGEKTAWAKMAQHSAKLALQLQVDKVYNWQQAIAELTAKQL